MTNLLRALGFLLVLTALAWRTGQPSDAPLCFGADTIRVTHRLSSSGWQDSTLHTHTYVARDPIPGCAP